MGSSKVVGLVVLVVVVSAGVYVFMDYWEERQQRIADEAYLEQVEELTRVWEEETAYYVNLSSKQYEMCPGHNVTVKAVGYDFTKKYYDILYCGFSVNAYSERWHDMLDYYIEQPGKLITDSALFKEVSRDEFRSEVSEYMRYSCSLEPRRSFYYQTPGKIQEFDVTIDYDEAIIFMRRPYDTGFGDDPSNSYDVVIIYWSLLDS